MNDIKILNKFVGEQQPILIIAEAGINHNGKLRQAKKLVDIAHKAGADAVKFQSWSKETIFASQTIFNKLATITTAFFL